MNPMAGSALQHARTATKEQAVEVLGKHEDGTRRSVGTLFPKGASAVSTERAPGSGLRGVGTVEG